MKVRLRIGSLCLEGLALDQHQEATLRAALESELVERFSRAEKFESSYTRRLAALAPELAARAEVLGRQVGRAIHGSVPRHAE